MTMIPPTENNLLSQGFKTTFSNNPACIDWGTITFINVLFVKILSC